MRTLKMTPECIAKREWYRKAYANPETREKIIAGQRRRREKNREHIRAKHRAYYASHREIFNTATNKWAKENHVKTAAGQQARRKTKLKDYCEVCGIRDVELVRHHFDYSKPTEVTTCCEPCHKKIHVGLAVDPHENNLAKLMHVTRCKNGIACNPLEVSK